MKEIPLTRGKVAIVDDEIFDQVNQFKWAYATNGYAHRNDYKNGKSNGLLMHRYIMNAKKGEEIDHVDRNRLNNSLSNLRIISHMDNALNAAKSYIVPRSSKYKGVFWNTKEQVWIAHFKYHGKSYYLGSFNSELAAAIMYNKEISKLSSIAYLNPINLNEEQQMNILKSDKRGKICDKQSGIKNITWCGEKQGWLACISINKKKYHIKSSKDIEIVKKALKDFLIANK
jgi:hypothetical protein